MQKIPLHSKNGISGYASVDDVDFDELSKFNWFKSTNGYAVSRNCLGKKTTYMHRVILKPQDGCEVDHRNLDRLDNTRNNLRTATRRENARNTLRTVHKKYSQLKGVTKMDGKWMAQIKLNYKNLYLGIFPDELTAARAYDIAAKEHFGEFALINKY